MCMCLCVCVCVYVCVCMCGSVEMWGVNRKPCGLVPVQLLCD